MKIRRVILMASLLLIGSCVHQNINIAGIPKTPYHEEQARQTYSDKVYALSQVIFDLSVTHYSKELRKLYVDEYAKTFELNEEEKNVMMEEQMEEARLYDDFYVSNFSSERGYQNLTLRRPPQQIWAIRLQDQDFLLRPINITSVRTTNQIQYFFPQLDGFRRLYLVRFSKSSLAEKTLTMDNPARKLTFTWKTSS